MKKELTNKQKEEILLSLKERFAKNQNRHEGIVWKDVLAVLEKSNQKLWSLYQMEKSGGEPDLVGYDKKKSEYIFFDCSKESPSERRSLCYDKEALDKRKENKPKNCVMDVAKSMDIELLTEEEYRYLQTFGEFDSKTSSWLKTPGDIRKLGGALFGDFRYGKVFVYHNGADSYYAVRGFRGSLRV